MNNEENEGTAAGRATVAVTRWDGRGFGREIALRACRDNNRHIFTEQSEMPTGTKSEAAVAPPRKCRGERTT